MIKRFRKDKKQDKGSNIDSSNFHAKLNMNYMMFLAFAVVVTCMYCEISLAVSLEQQLDGYVKWCPWWNE